MMAPELNSRFILADGSTHDPSLQMLTIAGKALAKALSANTTLKLKELDLSGNAEGHGDKDGPGFAKEFAVGLGANAALTSLDISNNGLGAKGLGPKKAEADISASEGDVVVYNGMQGVLGSWNSTYFGFTTMDGVKALADAIKNNGAIEKLLMAKNGLLTEEAGKILADMLKENSTLKELDVSDSGYGLPSSKKDGPGFAQELADGVKNNGALYSLNISDNLVPDEQAQEIDKLVRRNRLRPIMQDS